MMPITEENKQRSSRICVKNLPRNLTLQRFKHHFSQFGHLTDARLLFRDGKSRRMGFIGYKTEQEAEEAIRYFNKSCINSSQIKCEFGWISGNPNIPRAWSRDSKSATKSVLISGTETRNRIEKKTNSKSNEFDDPKLQEFLPIMQQCSKRKLWADDLKDSVLKQVCNAGEKHSQLKHGVCKKSVKETNTKGSARKEGVMHDENPTESHKMARDISVTDMDYLRSKTRKNWSDSESDTDEDGIEFSQDADDDPAQGNKEEMHIQGDIDSEEQESPLNSSSRDVTRNLGDPGCSLQDVKLEDCRLYVCNLPYAATEDEVAEFFNKFGNVKEVHLVIDKETKQPKGFGFVLYKSPGEAARIQSPEAKGKTYKQQREEKRKALEANGDTRAWNSLFMCTDTIVENIAREYRLSKSDLLDPQADNLAVRIALGESKIIAETKRALAKAGVNVASLEGMASKKAKGGKRSNHVILVKNLPFGSCVGELCDMFGRYGSLEKVIFPPTRTLALVVFVDAAEARAAFNYLRYRRYGDSLLYLEWAPSNIFCQEQLPGDYSRNDLVHMNPEANEALLEQKFEKMDQCELESDEFESRTLYVKNLDFGTTDERLEKHFREIINEGKILSAKVVKHWKGGKRVSSGYGFVEFDSADTVANAFRAFQGRKLDGRLLDLQLSRRKKDKSVIYKVQSGRSLTKLVLINVAFEATKKNIRQLFNPFGQVKSVRLPNKFGVFRGFAFVEYCTKQEAQNALKALNGVHFYGRPLCIQRAKLNETLEELRARTAAQFYHDRGDPIRITKKRKLM